MSLSRLFENCLHPHFTHQNQIPYLWLRSGFAKIFPNTRGTSDGSSNLPYVMAIDALPEENIGISVLKVTGAN